MADSVYLFVVNSMVHGYHQYKEIWLDPFVEEKLLCEWEVSNSHNPLAVAVKKTIRGVGLCQLCRHNLRHNRYAKASSIMLA